MKREYVNHRSRRRRNKLGRKLGGRDVITCECGNLTYGYDCCDTCALIDLPMASTEEHRVVDYCRKYPGSTSAEVKGMLMDETGRSKAVSERAYYRAVKSLSAWGILRATEHSPWLTGENCLPKIVTIVHVEDFAIRRRLFNLIAAMGCFYKRKVREMK